MPKIVDKAAKRQEILEAAIAVFGEKGYHSAKMAGIAVAAAKLTIIAAFGARLRRADADN